MTALPCPCFSGASYESCCAPLHAGRPAPSAERLMRSRFAAYAQGRADYILATTHPAGDAWRPDAAAWARDVAEFCGSTRFVGLSIVQTGSRGGDATVTFQAMLSQGGRLVPMVERSCFRKHRGRWAYLGSA